MTYGTMLMQAVEAQRALWHPWASEAEFDAAYERYVLERDDRAMWNRIHDRALREDEERRYDALRNRSIFGC